MKQPEECSCFWYIDERGIDEKLCVFCGEVLMSRINRDDYFMAMAILASMRSACLSRQVGAVVVSKNRVVSIGYNGPPPGYPHCQECMRNEPGMELYDCPAIHAEANAVIQATKGDTLYCTDQPCITCLKMILTTDIKRIVYVRDYPTSLLRHSLLKKSGIKEIKWKILLESILKLIAKQISKM